MIVYKLTDTTNGLVYVGQTKFTVEERFKKHRYSNTFIGKAIRAHGAENFLLEVLATCDTREQAYKLEMQYIAECDCIYPKGYNQIKGCFPLKQKNLGKGWIALYQDPSLWLAQQDLTGEQFKVMLVLRIGLKEIAKLLNMQVANVSRAMKKLKELNIIVEGPPAGKFKTYRLNPYIAHKGSNKNNTISDFNAALDNDDAF